MDFFLYITQTFVGDRFRSVFKQVILGPTDQAAKMAGTKDENGVSNRYSWLFSNILNELNR
jgi:hypothetical protein